MIEEIKNQLKIEAKNFYLGEMDSDYIRIADKSWKDIKKEVCQNNSYKQENWFIQLHDYEKTLVENLRQKQIQIDADQLIQSQ